jgi:hypothetical protein
MYVCSMTKQLGLRGYGVQKEQCQKDDSKLDRAQRLCNVVILITRSSVLQAYRSSSTHRVMRFRSYFAWHEKGIIVTADGSLPACRLCMLLNHANASINDDASFNKVDVADWFNHNRCLAPNVLRWPSEGDNSTG